MNFLAHLVLAGKDPDLRLGGFLGDFVKGRNSLRAYSAPVQAGIRLHRAIDHWVDHHPETLALKAQFTDGARRYAGILLDVAFDHVLVKHWTLWQQQAVDSFSAEVFDLMEATETRLPSRLKRYLYYAQKQRFYQAYADWDTVEQVLVGISQRMRRPGGLQQAIPHLAAKKPAVETAFLRLFPDLMAASERWKQQTQKNAAY